MASTRRKPDARLGGLPLRAALWACQSMLTVFRYRPGEGAEGRSSETGLLSAEPKLQAAALRGAPLDLTPEEYDCLAGALAGATAILAMVKAAPDSGADSPFPRPYPDPYDLKVAYRTCGALAGRYAARAGA